MLHLFFLSVVILLALSACQALSLSSLSTARRTSRSSLSMAAISGRALIVQNKGGGHGTIGYYLAKALVADNKGLEVVVLQDKTKMDKPPFSSYGELEKLGVKVVAYDSASKSLPAELSGMTFDYIVDNWSKKVEDAALVIETAKKASAKQVVFISSAGMYNVKNVSPIVETDPVKENDPRKIELALQASGLPYTFLRPQYIYGEKSNKRYLDYFIGRAHRNLPIPLPLSGEQLVCLTHVEDVASLISAALGHPKATNEVFNCGTDRYVSYKGLSQMAFKAVGSEETPKHLYYEPKEFDHWDGKGVQEFPFRRETFITTPSKAKLLLGWAPKHSLAEDLKKEVEEYQQMGGFKEQWTMEELKYDLEVIASKDCKFTFTYPFFDDEQINTETRPYSFESVNPQVEPK